MARLRTLLSRYRHGYLLLTLVLFVFVRPFLGNVDSGRGHLGLFDLMFGLTMVAAVYSTAQKRTQFYLFVVLVAMSLATRVVWRLNEQPETPEPKTLTIISSLVAALAWGYATVVVLQTVFGRTRRVTADTIFAAISGYLLIGALWTLLYVVLWILDDSSFEFGDRVINKRLSTAENSLLGFSFTTLTTLGYGNITPKSIQADALATLEAIFGQMYVAILVARLVGLQVAQATTEEVAVGPESGRPPVR